MRQEKKNLFFNLFFYQEICSTLTNIVGSLTRPETVLNKRSNMVLNSTVIDIIVEFFFFFRKVGWLFGFYSISTFGGYLMPNSVFTYIRSKIFKQILSR